MKFSQKNGQKDNDIKAQYCNTRSKFYNKQASFDKDDYKNQPIDPEQNTGGYWKQKGNTFFKIKNYDKAIECYTKAIQMNEGESQYYSNRSKCYQKQGNFFLALKDAEAACELNESNIKAHYICGCILAELGKFDDSKLSKAENRLKKALRLCTTLPAQEFSQEISIKIFRLKKLIWLKELHKQAQAIKAQKQLIRRTNDKQKMKKNELELISASIENREGRINEPLEIPDHLICKITLELMEDPVVSEAGYSYQRKALQEHYKLKGPIEPINRNECKGYIIPNHALKISIEQFLNNNPWGFQYQQKEDYRLLIMI